MGVFGRLCLRLRHWDPGLDWLGAPAIPEARLRRANTPANLGEGAGFVVLESERLVNKYQKKPYAELKGFANACDAYHQTASSPDGAGAYNAMKQAIDNAGLKITDIDYINLHGTATLINDQSEGRAVQQLFGDKVPYASSTKSFTGHTLGAAGGIEAVFSCMAISHGIIFPNLR
ncbi:MAG: hypothetical protein EBT05_04145, partial [Betaproteobacteria bacterium]|nr:hypothetical protein [Betaproteobacteria bacterium]